MGLFSEKKSTYLGATGSSVIPRDPKTGQLDINSLIGQMVDRHRDGLYDRVSLAAGVPTPRVIECFQKGVGPDKSWIDTNMEGHGQLNAPFDIIVNRFLMVFHPGGSWADELLFLRNYTWELWVLRKCLQRHFLLEFSVKGNIADVIRKFGSEDCKGTLERFVVPYAYNLCDLSRYIPPLTAFKVCLVGEPFIPKQGMELYSVLDGSVDWPVQ